MPNKHLLSKNELDELQEVGHVSLDRLNILLQNIEASDEDVEDLYDELEKRGIKITEISLPQKSRSPKTAPRRAKDPGDLDEVLASLADLETLMQKWDEVAEPAPGGDVEEEEDERFIEDGLGQFMNRVGRVPLLEAKEESTLLHQVQTGSEAERQNARQKLMEANQRLVFSLARRYSGRTSLPLQDLLQEGTLGLAKAIDNFGPERQGRLSSYATWWIRRSIRQAMENHTRSVRLPGEFYATIRKLQALQAELAQELGHNPSLDELAQAADMPLVKVEEALRAGRAPLSLEQPVGEDNELGESLQDDGTFDGDANFSKEELREELELALATLSETERIVVEKRFGMGDYEDNGAMTLEDVARDMGMSNEHTRRLEVRALRKLRRRSKNAAFGDLLE
jgi:RNA polymerase primary sigma factor